ncbi:MAG: signal peptide peptidase SppA [Rhodanobacteraceae bacterium]
MSTSSGFLGFLRIVGRGINITRIVILNLIFFGLLALLFGGMAARETARVAAGSVLVIEPSGELVEQYSIDPLQRALAGLGNQKTGQVRLRDLLRGIDRAASDSHIRSMLLLPDQLQVGGYAALREVGKALDRFKAAGKKVYVWSAGMQQAQYYLAAHANRIVLDPQGSVMLTGIGGYRAYYKDLLDKLGVTVHLFRVGQYKSAAEPYVLNHASDAAKKADAYWMNGLWDTLLDEVAANRKITPGQIRADIAAMPSEVEAAKGSLADLAMQQHLVDALMSKPDMRAWLRAHGQPAGSDGFRQIDLDHYLAATRTDGLGLGRKVAVVVAEGEISGGNQPPGSIGGDSTAEQIRHVRNDGSVAAMVLRVDSPGGAVYPAEQIRREVELTRKAGKPVIVSMGDVAASGGYWIGMNANRILAEPNTITGSIGIFGLYAEIPDTLARVGVHTDGVGTTPWTGAFDFRRPLDPRVGRIIQSVINKGYRDFVGHVAAARGKSFEDIDAIAQGRVWSGRQAQARGLVDQLGGLEDATRLAAKMAGLGKDYRVEYPQRNMGNLERLLLSLGQGQGGALLQAVGLKVPAAWLRMVELPPALKMLSNLKPGQPQKMAYCFCEVR